MSEYLAKLRDKQKSGKKPSSSVLADLRDAVEAMNTGYWNRQRALAHGGWDAANEGALRVREGDLTGLAGMFGGPASWLLSPMTALVPTKEEVYGSGLPEWAKPGMAGITDAMLLGLPGPDVSPQMSSLSRIAQERAGVMAAGARNAGETAGRVRNQIADAMAVDVPEGVTVYGAGPVIRKSSGTDGITSYHGTYSEPFSRVDFSKLGALTEKNAVDFEPGSRAFNLAKLGFWSHEKPLADTYPGGNFLKVSVGGAGRHFDSLDQLNGAINELGGVDRFREKMSRQGIGHISVTDDEFGGGKSYVSLSPETATIIPGLSPLE